MDHLLCFTPGLLALGVMHDDLQSPRRIQHTELAEKIGRTCYEMYIRQPCGLSPDIVSFPGFDAKNRQYRLRPEAVESFFYLFRLTKDEKYRDWGWTIFQSIEKHCRTEHGYGAIENVKLKQPKVADKMESFFLAETLKYHYLLQAPESLIPLDQFVFNTEAHPFRMTNYSFNG